MALKHPETFSRGFAIDGILDMEAICKKALAGEETGICHNKASLEAVFGDLDTFAGSENDLYALATAPAKSAVRLIWQDGAGVEEENRRLAGLLGSAATAQTLEAGADLGSCQRSLPAAVEWLVNG